VHPDADGLRSVVRPLKEVIAAVVTDPCDARRPPGHVIDRLAVGAGPSAAQAGHDLLQGQFVADDGVQGKSLLGQRGLQGLGLAYRPREAVE
jgi:hypothetical protein